MVGEEPEQPYMRTPLTKELWFSEDPAVAEKLKFVDWGGEERSLYYTDVPFLSREQLAEKEDGGVALATGITARKIDARNKTVFFSDGTLCTYDKLLLATGGEPRTLPVVDQAPEEVKSKVSSLRTIADY
eukprot:Colp12_sorted_trinity150504_noHs@35241